MVVNKQVWLSSVMTPLRKSLYQGCIYKKDVHNQEELITPVVDGLKADEPMSGWVYIPREDTSKRLFLHSDLYGELPIKIKKNAQGELMLTKSSYGKKVYYLLEQGSYMSLKIPALKKKDMMYLVENLNNFEVTKPDDYLIMKILFITALCTRVNIRIVSKPASGKDSIFNAIMNLTNEGINVTDLTPAKMVQSLDNKFIMYNEAGGMSSESVSNFSNHYLQLGDMGRSIYENKSTGSDKTKPQYDISNTGVIIAHNLPENYQAVGKDTFEEVYPEQVIDRFIPFVVDNGFKSGQFNETGVNPKKLIAEYTKELRDFIMTLAWVEKELPFMVLKHSLDKYDFKVNRNIDGERYTSNFVKIAKIVQLITYGEKEFYRLCDKLYESFIKARVNILEVHDE